jgi:hypothetical protein
MTQSATLNALRKEDYTEDFNLKQYCLEWWNCVFNLFAEGFSIDEFYALKAKATHQMQQYSMRFLIALVLKVFSLIRTIYIATRLQMS